MAFCLQRVLAGLALALVAAAPVQAASPPVIHTSCGPVKGSYDAELDVASFKGIPYALPPVGDRRWGYPVDIDSTTGCWEGVLDGTAFAPFCVQSGQFIGNAGSEDCLYLNLWIPNWSSHDPATAQLPTLVYLYGGDLTDGYTDNYPGGTLAAKTGAAYLSVNYRVNLFGFLATRELSATSGSGCSGNFGFADQQSALRWLQRNAGGLGLDAARVTVSGQSSGGTSVFALLSSPASKGLFSRALSLSGSVNLTMDRPTAEAQNAHIVQELGCAGMSSPTDTVACMRNQSTRAVQALVPPTWDSLKLIWGLPPPPTGSHVLGLDGIAIVDGCIVTKPFLEAVAEPIIDVPFMLGSLEQEPDAQPDDLVGNLTAAQWENMVKTAFQPFGAHAAEDVLGMYAPQAAVSPALAYTSIVADYGAFCANAAAAAAAARGFTSPVYHYVISAWPSAPVWNFDTRAPNRYAFHSFDILSAFDNYGIFSAALHLPLYKPTADDLALGHTIRQGWTQLMHAGALNGSSAGGWARVPRTASGGAFEPPRGFVTGVIGQHNATSMQDFKADVCKFWYSLGLSQGYWWSN